MSAGAGFTLAGPGFTLAWPGFTLAYLMLPVGDTGDRASMPQLSFDSEAQRFIQVQRLAVARGPTRNPQCVSRSDSDRQCRPQKPDPSRHRGTRARHCAGAIS